MGTPVCKLAAAVVVGLVLVLGAPAAWARHHHHQRDENAAAGQFDYYVLSLSWSPAFCIQQPDSAECSGPRRFAFIVHGLWPQYEQGWPQRCGDTQVPDAIADGIFDLMPARKLIDHEWTMHGSCSGLGPKDFFGLVRRAFDSVSIPASLKSPEGPIEQAPQSIVNEFLQENPTWPAESVVATCSSQGAPRLREVHVCFDRELKARACAADALREGCHAQRVMVPPVR